MPTSREQFAAILSRRGYSVAAGICGRQPKPRQRKKPVGDESPARESPARTVVVVTRCSAGRLDRDNLWGSAKAVCDALRYGGHITGDTESDIELIALQKKVKRTNTGTLIQIIRLP